MTYILEFLEQLPPSPPLYDFMVLNSKRLRDGGGGLVKPMSPKLPMPLYWILL